MPSQPTFDIIAVETKPATSKEQLKAFLKKVKEDTNLQNQLKAAKSQDDVMSIAKEHGHKFETEHISQLSEEELEGVAGGTGCYLRTYTRVCDNF